LSGEYARKAAKINGVLIPVEGMSIVGAAVALEAMLVII
jgi:hypothetical protein